MASENLISVPIHLDRPVQLWGGDQHRGPCADIGDDFPASGELTENLKITGFLLFICFLNECFSSISIHLF